MCSPVKKVEEGSFPPVPRELYHCISIRQGDKLVFWRPCRARTAQLLFIGDVTPQRAAHAQWVSHVTHRAHMCFGKRVEGPKPHGYMMWLRPTYSWTVHHWELSSMWRLPARTQWAIKAKFHYAIWSQTGPRLVADLSQTC